jgi:hypothetical protein
MALDKEQLKKQAGDPKYIRGIYNYCDRWCERCTFTSRCLNYTLAEERFGDLEEQDAFNAVFWERFSEMLQDTLALVKEMAREYGIDLDGIDEDATVDEAESRREKSTAHLITHIAENYAAAVGQWFDANDQLFAQKENELNRIRLVAAGENPQKEAIYITDAVEVIRWYQHQIFVKLSRAIDSAAWEAEEDWDDLPRDSDGSAKVALIGIDRSISAWQMLLSLFDDQRKQIIARIVTLEDLKNRVETQFPDARAFVRPGFDEISEA